MRVSLPEHSLSYEEIIPVVPFHNGFYRFPKIEFSTQCPREAIAHGVEQVKRSYWDYKRQRFPRNTRTGSVDFGFVHVGAEIMGRIGAIQVETSAKGDRAYWILFTCEANSVVQKRCRARFDLPNNATQLEEAQRIIRSTYHVA